MNNFANGIYQISIWVTRFAYLNILWIGFAIVGIVLFGLFPSTVAMFGVVRQWMAGEKDIEIFPVFWKIYRQEFKRSNICCYILVAIGYILTIEIKILRATEELVYIVASFGVVALFVIYFIMLIYFFPVFVHFNLKIKDYLKWPVIIGIIHPILTIFLVIVLMFLYYLIMQTIPSFVIFFGGSITAFILTWGASRTFSKYEATQT